MKLQQENKLHLRWSLRANFDLLLLDPQRKGLSIGIILGKDIFNSSVNPLFREYFILKILCIPSFVKCSLFLISSTANLNKVKSACFWDIKGNCSKCGIITLVKSFVERTDNVAYSWLLLINIAPTPKIAIVVIILHLFYVN